MNVKGKLVRILTVLVFSVGVLLGMALFGIMIWGDLEAELFDASMREDDRFAGLSCPVLMTTEEIGTVSATLDNPLDRPVEFTVRAHISDGYVTLMREIDSKVPLAPGEKETLEYPVAPEDAAYGRLVLVRVRVAPKFPIPARDGACGILVLDVPYFSGNQIFAFTLVASLTCMAVGVALWVAGNRPMRAFGRDVMRAMVALAAVVVIGLIVGLLGQWLLGVLLFVITLLLIGAMAGYFVNRSDGTPI